MECWSQRGGGVLRHQPTLLQRRVALGHGPCEPEICQLRRRLHIAPSHGVRRIPEDQKIRRLDVPVDDAPVVQVAQRRPYIRRPRDGEARADRRRSTAAIGRRRSSGLDHHVPDRASGTLECYGRASGHEWRPDVLLEVSCVKPLQDFDDVLDARRSARDGTLWTTRPRPLLSWGLAPTSPRPAPRRRASKHRVSSLPCTRPSLA